MLKKYYVFYIIVITLIFTHCYTVKTLTMDYSTEISTEDMFQAVNMALAEEGFEIKYSNEQGYITTDWFEFTHFISRYRMKLIINFSKGKIIVKPTVEHFNLQYNQWMASYSSRCEEIIEKLAMKIQIHLKFQAEIEWESD